MKNRKLKGFTLIELIVVVAIFSIILAGATALMVPAEKIMNSTSTQESAHAAATSYTGYISSQLSPAEYLHAYCHTMNSNADRVAAVENFTSAFYSGIVKADTIPSASLPSTSYATGVVHVLQIDNSHTANGYGMIRKWDYNVSFEPGHPNVQYSSAADPDTDLNTYPLNLAFYDEYRFEMVPGVYNTVNDYNTARTNLAASGTLLGTAWQNAISAQETSFTLKVMKKVVCPSCNTVVEVDERNLIDACPNCGAHITKKAYAYVTPASMALVNIFNRTIANPPGGAVQGLYFIVEDRLCPDPTAPNPAIVPQVMLPCLVDCAERNNSPILGSVVAFPDGATLDDTNTDCGYTFVYSFGAEVNTNP